MLPLSSISSSARSLAGGQHLRDEPLYVDAFICDDHTHVLVAVDAPSGAPV